MSKFIDRADKVMQSKAFKMSLKSVLYLCILLVGLVLFMVGSFLYKVYIIDYRFDDGELMPPNEASITVERFYI
ncbi:hypothetical protein IMZ08_17865 [Bacillus luteolus]|uniref:Uncharacterized protein n=1 Tax=Litchfieldia luteola TaxID=682179 RepID=A0ABR9QN18_9BACI|nr:hypothetical protein [Cytobacillus luteolus]MBE4909905.1 hypothetical protein [Cytobacillus luteolus]MBP1942540.1 hypothetical protein [Cytobacillus luteolus]